ncbi:DNA N6-methyl methyltransferase isoform X1 [Pieris napi]|uniref:DNA N6-methyl methyltransferase isoform X1 n=1 Tax=Pieris napi TaxID=78633 RepID=UPI001FBBD4D8|nr:DNA N6-methyl methyltransferase isoform X1 [Pieris napi]
MSIIFSKENICLIDHMDFVTKCYSNVREKNNTKHYTLTPKLFSIKRKSIIAPSKQFRKRKHNDNVLEEALTIQAIYNNLIASLPTGLKTAVKTKYNTMDASSLRDFSKNLFESTDYDHKDTSGGNNSEVPLICQIEGSDFLVPGKCRFKCGCVKEECKKLDGNKYDIVIADPPWWNKYIRRLKKAAIKLSYSMMYNEEIASIPINNLFSDTTLIAVWCTNSPSNINSVKELIFPKWGVEYVTTWYWLKLTIDLEPICPFSSGSKKQPYERLIMGRRGDLKVPKNVVFASIPSSLHSHKPPLNDLFTYYNISTEGPHVLELFARYLLPNTTSVGYEPLKWQNLALYVEVDNKKNNV